jgi:hypothetical protein
MRKIVLTFGLIAGAILSAMMLISMVFHDQIGFDYRGYIVGYTSMVLAFLMVYFGVRSYRDNVAGGRVGFGRAFAVGLPITVVGSVCYVATWEVVYYRFMPDFADKYTAYELTKAKQAGATDAQIEAQTKRLAEFREMYRNPFINAGLTFLEPLPVGLIFTLVTAGVLSRKRKEESGALAGAAAR